MKKTYIVPQTIVMEIKLQSMIAGSFRISKTSEEADDNYEIL